MTTQRAKCHLAIVAVGLSGLTVSVTTAQTLSITAIDAAPPITRAVQPRVGQLPHSIVARGQGSIAAAWLAAATDRYAHGVLGDDLEAGSLVVETRQGERLEFILPEHRVFEDLSPRLVDLDGDGNDEIVVVESDRAMGASMAVFGIVDNTVQRRAASPFIGQPNRWLNPLGAGDFDGDGELDLAAVVTPHIGGTLRLYRYTPPTLTAYAETSNVSTHRIGSTSLAMGHVITAPSRALLLVPDQTHRRLRLLSWNDDWTELSAVDLPGRLVGDLRATGSNVWRGTLDSGAIFNVELRP